MSTATARGSEGTKIKKRFDEESRSLEKFKAEWAVVQGREFRGTSFDLAHRRGGPHVESEEIHQHYVENARRWAKRSHRR